jgi:peptidoglycan/LPS O-acetylase OafA/YrhL
MFFIPTVPGAYNEVRGNGEMFPLNGPSWSLFFEYIGNILYALFICRISTKALRILTICLGLMLCAFTLSDFSGYGCLERRMDIGRRQLYRRAIENAFPVFTWNANTSQL